MQSEHPTIYLGDLWLLCSDMDIANAFTAFGTVPGVQIRKQVEKDGKTYAFVSFCDPQSALNACLYMDGTFFRGGQLR
jgi:RNA recognition motif-containing protein